MSPRRKRLIVLVLVYAVLAALAVLAWRQRTAIVPAVIQALPEDVVTAPGVAMEEVELKEEEPDIVTVATGLDVPWEIAFLPDGGALVTERPGNLTKIGPGGWSIPIEGVVERSESGLLGLALHPDFARNGWLYLYLTVGNGGRSTNRVDRFRLAGDTLTDRATVVRDIPGAPNHDGGRIAFGPDGKLYITTGDAQDPENAQDLGSLAGKILRVNDDGSIPKDNPFGTAVWSYGHRNPQGIAWDREGRLWATEHGRSGVQSGLDEVNMILPGRNYGWPTIQGDARGAGMETPVMHSGPRETWAPAGLAIIGDELFFGGLRGQSLYQARVAGSSLENLRAHFRDAYGRIRIVRTGPDGWLYVGTSNRDGRGGIKEGDDRIVKIRPALFER